MTNFGVVATATSESRIATNGRSVTNLNHRPAMPGPWVYVDTGDPELDSGPSPDWESDIYFVAGAPVAFRHGLDGQLDMVGAYDLTLGAVTGDLAFILPAKWRGAVNGFLATFQPLEVAPGFWSAFVQTIDGSNGEVRLYWPIVADPMP
jgi:hypothetical protein